MCSFDQNLGLLPLVSIALQKTSPVVKVSCKTVKNHSRYLGLCIIMIKACIHLPISGGVSTYHKSSNRIEISQLGQGLFDF